jgi:1-acyl-sn-glycerol-3-phosphate acyltransferase
MRQYPYHLRMMVARVAAHHTYSSRSASGLAKPRLRRVTELLLRIYMRLWHRLEVQGQERLPASGPALVLANHVSILDVMALAAANPYLHATTVIKASAFRLPLVNHLVAAWGAIPVARDGHDVTGARALMAALRAGWVVGIAAEGSRSRTGHLLPVNLVLARIAARSEVPLVPVGIAGSFDALPPGAIVPRPRKIVLRVGPTFRLARTTSPEDAARQIHAAIAALLPPGLQPL